MIHVALFGVALFFVVDFGVASDDDLFFVGGGCKNIKLFANTTFIHVWNLGFSLRISIRIYQCYPR